MPIPDLRVRALNSHAIRSESDYVLYWMVANRRLRWNFSLDRAVHWAKELKKPLLILEALRTDYRWASDRLHRFVIEGMCDNASARLPAGVRYYPYVEPKQGAGRGLVAALARRAAVIVSDDFPCFFLPRMLEAAARRANVRFEAVDSNGLLPLRATDRVFTLAHSFRRFLQKELLPHLRQSPRAEPLAGLKLPKHSALPDDIEQRWPAATPAGLQLPESLYGSLEIDHQVRPASMKGGSEAADRRLQAFVEGKLKRYADDRNQPEQDVPSGLSPYLHFGHISAHEIWDRLTRHEKWTESCVAEKPSGSAEGWWGMSGPAEGFADQLLTWRELGYNMCWQQEYDTYESLPDWARVTMEEHEGDKRPYLYSIEEFERAETHDPLWNAAQRQLVREGLIHNYLRMLWGKKIYEWSANGRDALETMIHLNNKYAVDGRNPNSYSGIGWVLGRYDRAWGPERKIFGKLRYMTSENTAKKVRVKRYLETYSAAGPPGLTRVACDGGPNRSIHSFGAKLARTER
ncbi:MAG: deoxyribodipyrimidine photolyase [Planctomycetales bacterium]|nr:deoxyribodipyrimidine photolyase [Planctomycetales bacterium]